MMIRTRSIRKAKAGDLATYRWGSLRKFENGRIFAPSERLLAAIKYHALPWEDYERHYLAEMADLYQKSPEPFLDLLRRPEVTLVCYESAPDRCHRRLLAELLARIGKERGLDVELDIQ